MVEYSMMFKKTGIKILTWLNLVLFAAIFYQVYKLMHFTVVSKDYIISLYYVIFIFVGYLSVAGIMSLFITDTKASFNNLVYTVFGGFYITILGSSLVFLRNIGWKQTLFLFIVVWIYDSMAYFIGSRYGKTKIIPMVSPNKSLEGLLGGLFSSCLAVLILMTFTSLIPFTNIGITMLITILLCVFAQSGDLVESLAKRYCGIKDSSNIIPGHGGVLDKIDSLLLAAPVYLVLLLLLC
jgi:phosphatidate cytidylyltransferase